MEVVLYFLIYLRKLICHTHAGSVFTYNGTIFDVVDKIIKHTQKIIRIVGGNIFDSTTSHAENTMQFQGEGRTR